MNKIKKFLKDEFITGTTSFDLWFLGAGLLLQVISIVLSVAIPEMRSQYTNVAVTGISAITGCISVFLCSRGKISQYFFGYIQLFTYLFGVAYPYHLGGEVAENWFYAITMGIGIYLWIKNYNNRDNGENAVKTKNMTVVSWIFSAVVSIALIILLALLFVKVPSVNELLAFGENPEPMLDSVTTVVPLVGQMLMCFGYSDQWIFWLVEDIVSIIMYIKFGDWVMVSQYIFWTANCVYGYIKWRKLANEATA